MRDSSQPRAQRRPIVRRSLATNAGASVPKKKKRHSTLQVVGTVASLNISPKGSIEGVLVETADGTVQLNFAKHDESVARSTKLGATIDVSAKLETDEGDHEVYVAKEADVEASGVIARLNYSLHGEVNGCHLADGTFVHVKPDRAKKHKLRIGDKVKATGVCRAGSDAVVLDADSIEKE